MDTSSLPSPSSLMASGQAVLRAESRALAVLADSLDDSFARAVGLILACAGRVVVSGMGKSGHVARKIAATMASTGTPALFVHPGEASHGDLGMIVRQDVVIALSNSGGTAELGDLIAYTRRFSIPLIAITSGAKSPLAQAADVTLLLPQEPEVGAMGLAPTTSTTMMLALGDALAVATLESRGFTAEDFRDFHPGGKLGQTLLRVADVMHTGAELPLATPDTPMPSILVTMTEKRFGCAGIVDGAGHLVGIVTDGDLRRHMDRDLLKEKAAAIMTPNPMTVPARMLASKALSLLNANKRTQLFVVEEVGSAKPVGILHIHDLLRSGVA